MATINKRGDFQYQAKVRRKGFAPQSKTFERRQDALDWAATIESEMRRGVFIDRSELERTTLAEALQRYQDEVVPRLKSEVSVRARVMAWLAHPLACRTLASLTSSDFAAYSRERLKAVKPATVRRDLMTIASVFSMVRHEWGQPIDDKLLTSVFRTLSPGYGRDRRPTPAEVELLLKEAGKYSADAAVIIELAIETGMRRGELTGLEWSQIDLGKKVIRLQAAATKNAESRIVPLTARAENILRAMPRSLCGRVFASFIHKDAVTKLFSRVCQRACIRDLCFHDLRHEAASRFAPHMPAPTLAKVMGWKSIQMAMRYYNPSEDELVSAVRMIG